MNADGNTLLHQAADHGHPTIIQKLIELNADLQANNANGRTAVGLAARNGRLKCLKLLTKAIRDKGLEVFTDGEVAIILASYNGHSLSSIKFECDAQVNVWPNCMNKARM